MHRLAHGHDQTTEAAYHAAALYLQGCLGVETAAGYTTEIFSEAKLGSETEMLAAVLRGDLAMATVTTANAAVTTPELGFFSAPYPFQGYPRRILDPDQTAVQTTEVREGLDPAISLDRAKEWSVFT